MSNPAPRITLDQWRAFVAVVDEGGYAQAAARLHRSQSTVTYSVQKLETQLGVDVFRTDGRKAVLTPTGRLLYDRARLLLDDAGGLERAARKSSSGWESELWLAVEVLFPTWILLDCLDRFGAESPHTRIELLETVLEGTPEALASGRADLGITPIVPANLNAELLMTVSFLPVAHPGHALHRLGRELSMRDLRKHRHIVVRDTGSQRDGRARTVEAASRWTVTNMATSIGAVCRGHGFAWLPADKIRSELDDGVLRPLPLQGGSERRLQMYLVFADPEAAGPGVRRLADIIREQVAEQCRARSTG